MTEGEKTLSYKDAGVDIDAGDALVEAIKPAAATTARAGVMDGLGGFGAMFDPRAAGFEDPVLVAATDGVGTKLKIAIDTGRLDAIGVDLVAMCVNDLVCQGAEPLFFLDYFATGRLNVARGAVIVGGVTEGCRRAGCALIGGETAEMPGMYHGEDFDLAGFAVGAAERGTLLPARVRPGDVLLGVASDGAHSNGYSLVRKIVERSGFGWADPAPFAPDMALGAALLTPTRIYVKSALAAVRTGGVSALAHITGGGLTGNLPRVLPKGVGAEINLGAWPLQPVFDWLIGQAKLSEDEALKTFNCGIGLIAVCPPAKAAAARAALEVNGETVFEIGRTIESAGREMLYKGAMSAR